MGQNTRNPTSTTSAAQPSAEAPADNADDPFAGVGGSYVLENGVRRRVAGPPIGDEPAGSTEPTPT